MASFSRVSVTGTKKPVPANWYHKLEPVSGTSWYDAQDYFLVTVHSIITYSTN